MSGTLDSQRPTPVLELTLTLTLTLTGCHHKKHNYGICVNVIFWPQARQSVVIKAQDVHMRARVKRTREFAMRAKPLPSTQYPVPGRAERA